MPSVDDATIRTFVTMRGRIRAFAESIDPADAMCIPDGFSNSIAWNVAHIWVTHGLLCYKLSGLPLPFEESAVAMYGKGSSPADWSAAPDYASLLPPLTDLADRFLEDLRAGKFTEFTPYTTSAGVELRSIDDAVVFNGLHEGIHLGYCMALRRAL